MLIATIYLWRESPTPTQLHHSGMRRLSSATYYLGFFSQKKRVPWNVHYVATVVLRKLSAVIRSK